ncbi:hypothetical protein HBH53_160160 [Parastagonospora nodorum]|nr:hypothetical protein HBH53_160160 [Parastagonospora nodorum]KAH5420238.1 hypothetical protein HBI47_136410 [Parastagonospora nodorum]KAH5637199.1 hypothetical protein HBI23_208360 [Parastagonospora nodorum]KAH5701659.1 hypothetical protein HBI44_036430 [Parastagonospora nodorum]KAH5735505.1 hypothetical protein HBI17_195530 [Parastagonospora nodorum]
MRISKYVPFLEAILPLALAQYSTPPPPTNSTCSVDAYQCSGNTFQKCAADGIWQDIAKCSMVARCSAQYSVTAGRGGCLPDANVSNSAKHCSVIDERRCDTNNNLQECADNGQWGTIKNCTKTALCSAEKTATDHGGCYPIEDDHKLVHTECFEVGIHRCSNGKNSLETCGDDGNWKTVKQCKEGETCKINSKFFDGGQCLPPSPVSPSEPSPGPPKDTDGEKCSELNAYRCNNNVLENCGNTGHWPIHQWKEVKSCLKSETCMVSNQYIKGTCVPSYVPSNPYPAPPAEPSPAPPKESSPTLPVEPSPTPPKDTNGEKCPKINAYRCNNNILEKCDNTGHWPTGYWKKVKSCLESEMCIVKEQFFGCLPSYVPSNPYPTPPADPAPGPPKESSSTTSTPTLPTPTPPKESSPAPPMDDERCQNTQARCNENMIQTCDGEFWSAGSSCGKDNVCIENCGRKMCRPYCMNREEYYTVVGDSNNSSTTDAAPVVERSELEACDRPGLERCMYDAPVRTQSCTNGTWVDKEVCPEDTICWADNDGDETAECAPMPEIPPQVNKTRSESCDRPGLERCMYDTPIRTQSCTNGTWTDKKICPANTICWADNDGDETAECVPSPGLPPQAMNARPKTESCDRLGLERCMYDTPVRTQSCTNGTWTDKEICPEMTVCWADNDGTEAAECLPKPGLPPYVRSASLSARSDWPTEPCRPGHFNCDSDRYSLLLCRADKKWHFSKKCLTPGDCMVDGPGQAHCESGEMDPPKAKRSECNSGDRACDKDRRFLFTCNDSGNWDEAFQCFREGYCRPDATSPLTCAGWPLFDGNDGACKSACEGLYYLYCIGDNWKKPEKVEECRRNMCTEKECGTCDRCNFKLPYGVKPQVDLSTLVRGSK